MQDPIIRALFRFNEAAGVDPADASLMTRTGTFADRYASMRPRG